MNMANPHAKVVSWTRQTPSPRPSTRSANKDPCTTTGKEVSKLCGNQISPQAEPLPPSRHHARCDGAIHPRARPAAPGTPGYTAPSASPASAVPPGEQATIGKSLVIKGEVSGSESLYVDGKIEGAINLPGNRVTVGRNGQVAANIMAREVVVLGKVRGNVHASDRVDIRSEGSLTGDVIAARISIEDGAFFKGGIDIRKPGADAKPGAPGTTSATPAEAATADA